MFDLRLASTLPRPTFFSSFASPLGTLTLTRSGHGISALLFDNERHICATAFESMIEVPCDALLQAAEQQLTEYFIGRRRIFDLAMDLQGTHFQRKVWDALLKIPYGRTTSYGKLAL